MAQLLPGLLDDPHFQDIGFLGRSDLHIAPLLNPVPTRTVGIPSPLEPKTSRDVETTAGKVRLGAQQPPSAASKRTPPITPATVILARDTRKPITAISELLESTETPAHDAGVTQLPSFVSLSVVEKTYLSPILMSQEPRATKRPRLDLEAGITDDYIHLPRPQQQHQGQRAPPLLPSIVNGIHEPPPNAALLPPMATESQSRRENRERIKNPAAVCSSKNLTARPPEKMLNSPELETVQSIPASLPPGLAMAVEVEVVEDKVTALALTAPSLSSSEKPQKTRKRPQKWTDEETQDLLRGVEKHGFGKWKLVLDDPVNAKSFESRTAVDLKDRYRVCITNKLPRSSDATVAEEDSGASIIHATSANGHASSTHVASKRRVRRAWTADEDAALLRGVNRHGFQWTLIHDDPELELAHRKATDLRDRIRNRYKEGYKNAETAQPKAPAQRKSGTKRSDGLAVSATDCMGAGMEHAQDQPGMTLPPLALDGDDWDWGNTTLPPLLDWEEMGI